ncbi:hypothetical protein LWC33_23515 [Pseudonocardia sp. RS11V-5]|uniref:hypothetical protein n=1 Tax=Pseudonocardia terrae TaxID=2905831 RepID=UPI001E539581|nr:hypothetical protein [Pseudonocardia terrae]MCE3554412.1 hypothetical protein [Pseudonocardia terrae]
MAWTAVVFAAFLTSTVIKFDYFSGSDNASAYWVGYEDGFIRRGLVGAILATLLGGPPGPIAVTVLAVIVFAVACIALIWLTAATIRTVVRPGDGVFVAAVLIASPFTFALTVQNRGRYDSVAIAGLVVVAALSLGSSRRSLRVLAMALVTALTVATAEVAFPFLVVLVLLGLSRLGWSRWGLAAVAAPTLLPGLLLTIASFAVHLSTGYLATLTDRAARAGLAVNRSQENSISALGQSTADALGSTTHLSPLTLALCFLVLGGCYAASGAVLWACTGRGRTWAAVLVITAHGLVALRPGGSRVHSR